MRKVLLIAALLSLVVCLGSAWAYFVESLSRDSFRTAFAVASVAWFVLATCWVYRR